MAEKILYVLGAVFVIVGLLGFVMDSPLLGLFAVNATHNVIHLLSGILAIAFASMGTAKAVMYAKVFGIVYLLVAILGFVQGDGNLLGLVAINGADNILHVLLAAILLWVGFGMSKGSSSSMPTGMPQ